VGGLPTNRTVNGFAVDPQNSKTMFVAMRDGLFKSTDAGASWKSVGNELKNLAAVTINPKRSTEMFVSTIDGTIYMSADAGMKWKKQQ
jgi:photosystem II stability/assembly factor-like uncharacterized protein